MSSGTVGIKRPMLIQIPIPPPHSETALYISGLSGFAALVMALRWFWPNGQQRLVDRRAKDDSAISILQGQVATLQNEVASLKGEVRRMGIAEKHNQKYRHALAGQCHALAANSENHETFIRLVFEEWPEAPHHLIRLKEQLHTSAEIIERNPLPRERELTDEEWDSLNGAL